MTHVFVGFFVEINLFKASKEKAAEMAKTSIDAGITDKFSKDISGKGGLADEDANLMIKLKFLTYKVCSIKTKHSMYILFIIR